MKMHAYSHLSISTIITRTRVIWIPIVAYFLFKETLLKHEYLGILILFIGISFATSPKKFFTDKGLKYAFQQSFAVSFVNVLMKMSSAFTNTSGVMVSMAAPSVLFFPVLMKNARARIITSMKIKLPIKVLAGFVNATSMFLLAKAIEFGPVGKVVSIYQSMLITSVLAGIFILKEKEDITKKIVGSLITIVGVLLLTT